MDIKKGLIGNQITLSDVESNIESENYFTAAEATRIGGTDIHPLDLLTFCVLVLRNGTTVTGEAVCSSPENLDEELGRKIARQNAIEKVWSLMDYELKCRLSSEKQ